jgi:regulatory protein
MSANESGAVSSATSAALRLLARRPLTRAELHERLVARDHPVAAADAACTRLRELGYLDDRRLALDFIVTRAERLGHGPARLVDGLCRRGVAREDAEAALRLAVERGDLSVRDVLRRRLARQLRQLRQPRGRRDYARMYNALRRAGFDEEAIRQEIDAISEPALHDEPTADETTDDFP